MDADPVDIEWVDDPKPGLPERTLQITLGKAKLAIIDLSGDAAVVVSSFDTTTEHRQSGCAGNSGSSFRPFAYSPSSGRQIKHTGLTGREL